MPRHGNPSLAPFAWVKHPSVAPPTFHFCVQRTWLCTRPSTSPDCELLEARSWVSFSSPQSLVQGLTLARVSWHMSGEWMKGFIDPENQGEELLTTRREHGCFFHFPFLTEAKRVPRLPSLPSAAGERVRRGAFVPPPDGWSWDRAQQLCLGGRREDRWPGVCLQTAWETAALVQGILRGGLHKTVVK